MAAEALSCMLDVNFLIFTSRTDQPFVIGQLFSPVKCGADCWEVVVSRNFMKAKTIGRIFICPIVIGHRLNSMAFTGGEIGSNPVVWVYVVEGKVYSVISRGRAYFLAAELKQPNICCGEFFRLLCYTSHYCEGDYMERCDSAFAVVTACHCVMYVTYIQIVFNLMQTICEVFFRYPWRHTPLLLVPFIISSNPVKYR